VVSRDELLENLKQSGDEVRNGVGALTDSDLARGRYENGWNGQQILAHLASIEWTYPRLIEMARESSADQAPSGGDVTRATGGPVITDYNERQVAKRSVASRHDLLEEFNKNRAATIAAVEATPEDLLAKRVKSAGGADGALADVLQFVAVDHVRGHLQDLTAKP
jgi:Mycothiol maleylpyruvate isomerase N-terminal domain